MEAYLNEEEIPHERIAASLHQATLDIKVTPVLCGSSFKNKGVQPLLDAIVELLPSPLEVPPVEGIEPPAKGERGASPAGGRRRRCAVRRARLQGDGRPVRRQADLLPRLLRHADGGNRVLNASTGRTERIGRLLMMHANHREEIEECYAGDICAGVGLKQTSTGDTLCAPDAPIELEHDRVPGAGDRGRDRAEDEGRPGEARDEPRRASPRRTRPSRSRPTRRPARR